MLTLERENSSVLGDLVGVERALRDEEQRVDLPHGAVDAPLAAHLAEVGDELAVEGRKVGGGSHAPDCRADGCNSGKY
jgi:hypothetical protein